MSHWVSHPKEYRYLSRLFHSTKTIDLKLENDPFPCEKGRQMCNSQRGNPYLKWVIWSDPFTMLCDRSGLRWIVCSQLSLVARIERVNWVETRENKAGAFPTGLTQPLSLFLYTKAVFGLLFAFSLQTVAGMSQWKRNHDSQVTKITQFKMRDSLRPMFAFIWRVCVQWTMITVSVYRYWKPCSATGPLQCHKTNTGIISILVVISV